MEYVKMSVKELDRLSIMEQVRARKLTKTEAARRLGISRPHCQEVYKVFCRYGAQGLVSKKRGQPSNNRIAASVREAVVSMIRERYADFKPTLAHEKLTEVHGFRISDESVRRIMIAEGLWQGKRRKVLQVHPMRARRPCFGELVQIDGSPHLWFEDRRASCCLLVLIDDATSQLLGLRFVETECLQGYFDVIRDYIERSGRPLALYSDQHSIFHMHIKEALSGTGEIQFGRAMRELDIEVIAASSPQAKGRVERANGILQDRLVKEMRLLGISDIDTANAWLPTYMADYNRRFAVPPAHSSDAHRKELPNAEALDLIFAIQNQRKLSKNLELSYKNVIYQIQSKTPGYSMQRAMVTVCESKGQITLLYKGGILSYKVFEKGYRTKQVVSSKELNDHIDKRSFHRPPKPKSAHPWRQGLPSIPQLHSRSHLPTVPPKQIDSWRSSASESYG